MLNLIDYIFRRIIVKKKIASFLLVLIVGVLVFTGCGFQALKGGPKNTDPVSSNGGLVVQKVISYTSLMATLQLVTLVAKQINTARLTFLVCIEQS